MEIHTQGCKPCRFQAYVLCLSLAIITVSLYLPAAGFDFIHLDDGLYVTNNPFVQHGISFKSILYAFVTTEVSYWHPLTWISHMLDCEIFGMDAGGHHWINILIHTANSILLFLVLRAMTGATWKSFFAAALFAWHPLGVETVAWISERKNLLCTFFWILTIWSHWRYAQKPCAKRNLLTGLFLVLAFMAKPMAVTLPVVLLLMDIWPLKRFPGPVESNGPLIRQAGRLLLEKTTFFIITFFICVLTIYAQKNAGAISNLESLPILPRITNAVISYAAYLGKMIWPVDLAILYPYTDQLRLRQTLISAVPLILITVMVLWTWRKQPHYAVGWFWYIITLLPMIGLLQVGRQAMADRYTYVPLIGVFIMIIWGLGRLVQNRSFMKILTVAVGCVVLFLCLISTRLQMHYWKDSIALFSHTLHVAEENYKDHFALSCAYFDENQFENSEKHLLKAIKLAPDVEILHIKLGLTFAKQRQFEKARSEYECVLQMNPNNASACYYLGMLYEQQYEYISALKYYNKASKLMPTSQKIPNRIAWLLSTCPDPSVRNGQEAVRLAKQLKTNPFAKHENPEFLCTLASAYAEVGQYEQAVLTAEKALQNAFNQKEPDEELIEKINICLKRYKQGLPYRDTSFVLE